MSINASAHRKPPLKTAIAASIVALTITLSGCNNNLQATEAEPPTAMLDYLFETLPAALQPQREQIANKYRGGAA